MALQIRKVATSVRIQVSKMVGTGHEPSIRNRAAFVIVAHLVSSSTTTELELAHPSARGARDVLVLEEPGVAVAVAGESCVLLHNRRCILDANAASLAIGVFDALFALVALVALAAAAVHVGLLAAEDTIVAVMDGGLGGWRGGGRLSGRNCRGRRGLSSGGCRSGL